MHIMEGYLPIEHAVGWWLASAPFLAHGVYSVKRTLERNPEAKLLLGASGGFAFVLSALKLPSVTGSCSHPTGVGLGAILLGLAAMSVLGAIVLLFQALFLAHGGLTTLGANGAGKTTLLLQLNGMLRPTRGTVFFEGQPADYSRKGILRWRQKAGLVFQHPDDQLYRHLGSSADGQSSYRGISSQRT